MKISKHIQGQKTRKKDTFFKSYTVIRLLRSSNSGIYIASTKLLITCNWLWLAGTAKTVNVQ